jgi:hypothetical protein
MWTSAPSWADWKTKFSEGSASVNARTDYRDKLYRKQFDDLYRSITGSAEAAPKLDRILAPVEFKNGEAGFKTMMAPTLGVAGAARGRPAPAPGVGAGAGGRDIDTFFEKPPLVEECWYAQEDFWVKSEMLNAVRRTLDAVGKFSREEKGFWSSVGHLAEHPDRPFSPYAAIKEMPAEGHTYVPEAECRFRNSSWELHLLFEQDKAGKIYVSGNSTLKNVHPSHRVQSGSRPPAKGELTRGPLQFRMRQKLDKGDKLPLEFTLKVKTADMPWNKSESFKDSTQEIDVTFVDPRKPFEVEQIYDWYTAPIRRIDEIKTCYHSHRDANVQLKPHPGFAPKPDEAAAQQPVNPSPAAPPGAGPPAGPELPQPTENNGLERNRYLNVTDTCRDMPFALVVVLEQPHLHDFVVQLANSHLRVQITQITFNRVRNVGPLPVEGGAPGAAPGVLPGREGGIRPGGAAAGPADDFDPNLVEVSVYGIAAMYEKFKKTDVPKAPGQP